MPTKDDILLRNLDDALQQAQRYLWLGVVSAALFVVLSMRAPGLIANNQEVEVPVVGKAAPGTAAVVFFLGFLAFPVLASLAIARIRRIASSISDRQIVDAALTRFSILTLDSTLLRVISALIAPLLILSGYGLEQLRGAERLDALKVVVGFPFISAPYLLLASGLVRPFVNASKEAS